LLAPKPTRGGREEMAIATVNPATGQVVKTFESLSDAELEVKLQKAADRFLSYRKTPFAERARLIENAARVLEKEKESYARVMTTEMGKTFRSAVDEAAKCAWVCRYYAENAERILADEVVETTAKRSFIRYLPLGPVLGDPRVAAATLTGSEGAGVEVGVGAAKRIKKVVLELGGSDPFIVMPSANLEAATSTGVKARIFNNGQSCIAAKRFIVAERI